MTMRFLTKIFSVGVCIATTSIAANAAYAVSLAAPSGDVVLTVTGAISVKNTNDAAIFDIAALKSLGATQFSTTIIWIEGMQTFEGVSLKVLLDSLGVDEGTIVASAVNDYAVEIPISDAVEGGPIVAYSLNDAPMSLRDKGPLWVVYPYDQNPEYQNEVTYTRSIWQLDRIEIIE